MEDSLQSVSAVVLAGRENTSRLKDVTAEQWEALIDIGGQPMLSWVLNALKQSRSVGSITVVAPRQQFAPQYEGADVTVVEPRGTMIDNALEGCRAAPDTEFVLVATSDIPFITGPIVDRFVDLCLRERADFFYPILRKHETEQRFPGVKRTYATLKEGTFTGGNIGLIRKSMVWSAAAKANAFVENRKSPVKQAGLLGWSFVLKLLLKSLSLTELERTISRYLGLRGKAVILGDPEIGVDVDKPEDLELARRMLQV